MEDGTVETRYDYPDGSVRISGFKPGIDESQIAPLAVEGGKWQTVSGASYCIGALVYEKTAFVHLEFMILTAQQV